MALSTPLSAITGGYFFLFLLLPTMFCLQPRSKISENFNKSYKFLRKLTILYAGLALNLQQLFDVSLIETWVTERKYYTTHLRLEEDSTKVYHILIMCTCASEASVHISNVETRERGEHISSTSETRERSKLSF